MNKTNSCSFQPQWGGPKDPFRLGKTSNIVVPRYQLNSSIRSKDKSRHKNDILYPNSIVKFNHNSLQQKETSLHNKYIDEEENQLLCSDCIHASEYIEEENKTKSKKRSVFSVYSYHKVNHDLEHEKGFMYQISFPKSEASVTEENRIHKMRLSSTKRARTAYDLHQEDWMTTFQVSSENGADGMFIPPLLTPSLDNIDQNQSDQDWHFTQNQTNRQQEIQDCSDSTPEDEFFLSDLSDTTKRFNNEFPLLQNNMTNGRECIMNESIKLLDKNEGVLLDEFIGNKESELNIRDYYDHRKDSNIIVWAIGHYNCIFLCLQISLEASKL